jgi:hypothetical protein
MGVLEPSEAKDLNLSFYFLLLRILRMLSIRAQMYPLLSGNLNNDVSQRTDSSSARMYPLRSYATKNEHFRVDINRRLFLIKSRPRLSSD